MLWVFTVASLFFEDTFEALDLLWMSTAIGWCEVWIKDKRGRRDLDHTTKLRGPRGGGGGGVSSFMGGGSKNMRMAYGMAGAGEAVGRNTIPLVGEFTDFSYDMSSYLRDTGRAGSQFFQTTGHR